MNKTCCVDCKQGRELGCKTYCCRLLVRLTIDEMKPAKIANTAKGFIDKDADGYCIHLDRKKFLCGIWNNRPEICKSYDCNRDFLLQVAIKKAFNNLVDLVNAANTMNLSKEDYIQIPYTKD